MTVHDIRHVNLLHLIAAFGSIQKFATAVGKSHSQISQLRNSLVHSKTGQPRVMGDKLARDIELKLGKPIGWMDRPQALDSFLDLPEAAPSPETVRASTVVSARQLVEALGTLLADVGEPTRRGVMGVLSGLVEDPGQAPLLGRQVEALLNAGRG